MHTKTIFEERQCLSNLKAYSAKYQLPFERRFSTIQWDNKLHYKNFGNVDFYFNWTNNAATTTKNNDRKPTIHLSVEICQEFDLF